MQPRTDYTEELATEIDHGPHWSSRSDRTPPPELAAAVPPRLPRAYQVSAAPLASRAIRVAPAAKISTVSHAPPRAPLPPPTRPAVAFYSYAEQQASQDLDTERVAPLPMSSIRPSWIDALDSLWQRFAAPICGAIAGLIFVVGYLAYSSQHHAAIASAATGPMPLAPEVAMIATPAAPTVTTIEAPAPLHEPEAPANADPTSAAAAVRLSAPVRVQAPTVGRLNVPSTPSLSKRTSHRAPVRLNDATPLGDLRPSRSR